MSQRSTALETPEPARARLLISARALFAERGFDGASTREIADRARVQQGLVRHHFGGKQGLWREVVSASLVEVDAVLSAEAQPADAGRDFFERWSEALIEHRELLQVVVHALLEPGERRSWLFARLSASAAVAEFVAHARRNPGIGPPSVEGAFALLRAISVCALPAFAPAWQASGARALDAESIARVARDAWAPSRTRASERVAHALGPWSLAAAAQRRRTSVARDS